MVDTLDSFNKYSIFMMDWPKDIMPSSSAYSIPFE